ncbi:hypothetical protein HELRODRAFT_172702 [Helobdella robusta]|uniref:Chitin-binding type-2 domain-containing protein n=1 Tax=Helobdella robusta TaxID=6412 RepID=T1F5T7_HELRO|nr:hypothetical protein HELRODRAFT_172702 [Helobdella robusta]ESO04340.1 hypothetical protein HELRODRAFT_172702 [Helobdella robusta]
MELSKISLRLTRDKTASISKNEIPTRTLAAKQTFCQMDCTGFPDGSYGAGCRSYTACKGGVGTLVTCKDHEAYDYDTKKCERIEDVKPPCGLKSSECINKPNGRYPLMSEQCRWYFTCQNQKYLGANPCNNPPSGTALVFDKTLDVCNWATQVPPPCGTKQ